MDVRECVINKVTHFQIKLKNHWGEVGRAYAWNEANTELFITEQKAYGEFWLDLAEFTRYFSHYTVCDPIPGLENKNTFVQSDLHANTHKHK